MYLNDEYSSMREILYNIMAREMLLFSRNHSKKRLLEDLIKGVDISRSQYIIRVDTLGSSDEHSNSIRSYQFSCISSKLN